MWHCSCYLGIGTLSYYISEFRTVGYRNWQWSAFSRHLFMFPVASKQRAYLTFFFFRFSWKRWASHHNRGQPMAYATWFSKERPSCYGQHSRLSLSTKRTPVPKHNVLLTPLRARRPLESRVSSWNPKGLHTFSVFRERTLKSDRTTYKKIPEPFQCGFFRLELYNGLLFLEKQC